MIVQWLWHEWCDDNCTSNYLKLLTYFYLLLLWNSYKHRKMKRIFYAGNFFSILIFIISFCYTHRIMYYTLHYYNSFVCRQRALKILMSKEGICKINLNGIFNVIKTMIMIIKRYWRFNCLDFILCKFLKI